MSLASCVFGLLSELSWVGILRMVVYLRFTYFIKINTVFCGARFLASLSREQMDSVEMIGYYILSIFPQSFVIFPTISSYPRSIYSTFVISVSPRAIILESIIVTHALKSHDETVVPLRWVRPNIIASCGFMMAICPFIFSISMSQLSLPSKRTSWIRDIPSAWVRRSANGDWRSVGNPG